VPLLGPEPTADQGAHLIARYYRLRHGRYEQDIPFYQGLVARAGPLVLELGCGDGRLLEPLAAAGATVLGLDNNRDMLTAAAERIRGQPRVYLALAELEAIPARGAGLAILALNTFCHFASQEKQERVLGAIYSALAPGGLLAMDLPNPHVELEARPDGACLLEGTYDMGDGWVQEWSVCESDPAEQTLRITSLYDCIGRDGMIRREWYSLRLRLFYRYELELLLRCAGLEVEAVLGDYDYRDYTSEAPRMLVLARRPTRSEAG